MWQENEALDQSKELQKEQKLLLKIACKQCWSIKDRGMTKKYQKILLGTVQRQIIASESEKCLKTGRKGYKKELKSNNQLFYPANFISGTIKRLFDCLLVKAF